MRSKIITNTKYKFLVLDNNKLINNNFEKDANIERFEKVLNNLLSIKNRGDSAVFTAINKTNIDLFSLLNEKDINNIFSNYNFKIKIPRKNISDIKKIISNIKTKKDLLLFKEELNISTNYINSYNFVNDSIIYEQENWDLFVETIINKNKEAISSFNSKWTRFIKNYKDIYEQDNIWPLYIGAFFIKSNINGKSIYAPLLLKEIEIIEEENEIYIVSKNDSLIFNEKIIFFLEEYKSINFPKLSEEIEQMNFLEVAEELSIFLKDIINCENDSYLNRIIQLKAHEISESDIVRMPGMAMMICNPVGSALRRAVLNLINENKLSGNLIKSNSNSIDDEDIKFINQIIEEKKSIPRICQTDLSQEKAIFSSLEDSTIIIGPPGTGKSQTIANILANILFEGKTALFISQKKVALQVVLERLKKLRFFTFQLVESANKRNSTEKEEFYSNLNKFLELVSSATGIIDILDSQNNNEFKPLLEEKIIQYWDSKKELTSIEINDIEIFCDLKNNIPLLDVELIKTFINFKNEYIDTTESSIDIFKFLKNFLLEEFSKKFLQLVDSNKEGLNNLTWNEIVNFIDLQNEYGNIEKEKIKFLFDNKKYFEINWNTIEKFNEVYELLDDKIKNNYKILSDLLISINDVFIKLKSINKFDYIDQLHNLSYSDDKNLFAKEFGIEKNNYFIFKSWGKDFKVFWSINKLFKNRVKQFKISRTLINKLKENHEMIMLWNSSIQFLSFLVENKITEPIYKKIIDNLSNLNAWIKYYDFLRIIQKYSLNESLIITLKKHQNLLQQWIEKFDFYNLINKYNVKYNDIELIKQVSDTKNIEKINEIYEKHHKEFILNSANFNSNEKVLLKKLMVNNLSKIRIFDSEEKEEFRRLKGRIERRYTKPHILISKFKNTFKKIFNVVVSTPETLATYVDFINEKYDYVIFDEASQMFLEKAIPFLAIGEKIIIAGDDQQMQPTNWFGLRVNDENSDEQEDEKIDSLLTYAINSGIKKQVLELNYRSQFANLTTFSSKHFYDSKLKCLDSNNETLVNSSIDVIDVNGKWEDSINLKEAKTMIKILKENIDNYEKIILLTFNAYQMDQIDLLLSTEEPKIYKKILNDRTIILKNLENIQGDEADLVIASIAYTKETKLAGTYVCRQGGKNALNVAITRAKQKMIILKSIHSSEISTTNENILLFKRWLEFIELDDNEQRSYSIPNESIQNAISLAESSFEVDVLKWLENQEFKKEIYVESQYRIGSYKIDIAIIDKKTKKFLLGIEVDGYRYHSSPKQKYQDELRQSFIESKGYRLIRIPEMLWKSNKQKIWNSINQQIEV